MPATRRYFLKYLGAGALLASQGINPAAASPLILPKRTIPANDKIRVASIGMGIIGFDNMATVAQMPGAEFVAAADCYDGRLARVKEVYGQDVFTTRNYQELLSRSDIDAVAICAPDHWHAQMAVDIMKAGKAVYIEKPIVQKVEDGHRIIEAQQQTGQIAIVGSNGFRSPLYQKAKELIRSGVIGQLNVVESTVYRNDAVGAWQYSLPSDASPETIDWKAFLGPAPDRPFDADRFFRWRKYWDYGTGVSGDMFVHRLSGLHFMLDSMGPVQIAAMGGVQFWNDGRETPDVLTALLDYPETASHSAFTLILKANFSDGSGGPSYRFVGSEGVLEIGWRDLHVQTFRRRPPTESALVEGYNSVRTFASDQREQFVKEFRQYHSGPNAPDRYDYPAEMTYQAPDGYNDRVDHWGRFLNALRGNNDIIQDPTFGLRAAAPAILPNDCYRQGKVINWDPVKMVVKG